MSEIRRLIRHPATRVFFLTVFTVLAVWGFVEQGDFWDGILTAMWVVLGVTEAGELLYWWVRRQPR